MIYSILEITEAESYGEAQWHFNRMSLACGHILCALMLRLLYHRGGKTLLCNYSKDLNLSLIHI